MQPRTEQKEIALKPPSIDDFLKDVSRLAREIEQRAYSLFEWRGAGEGRDWEDWFKAEQELLKPLAIEIGEKNNALYITAEVPGFQAEEIEINLEPNVLFIKGFQKSESEKKHEKTHYTETQARQVFRRVPLPMTVVPDKSTATLKNGLLAIIAPKAEEGKRVAVKAA